MQLSHNKGKIAKIVPLVSPDSQFCSFIINCNVFVLPFLFLNPSSPMEIALKTKPQLEGPIKSLKFIA